MTMKVIMKLKLTKMAEQEEENRNDKFAQAEEMYCPFCQEVTGHSLVPHKGGEQRWACVYCGAKLDWKDKK